jgi:catechol 2,3-dioxygenase
MKVKSLGHVVLRVTDLARSEDFYTGVLGIPVCARYDQEGIRATFYTLGNHHDLAIMEVTGEGSAKGEQAVGLDHVAFCIGTTLEELKQAKAHLVEAGVTADAADHEVTKSLYLSDPDGNGVELYVDVSEAWKLDPQRIAQEQPLEI